uniref:Uncharacterized protein n=1 Tax=Anguilla anguilla TaxID=7936 RepID=A0A0E9S1B9_ANGAN
MLKMCFSLDGNIQCALQSLTGEMAIHKCHAGGRIDKSPQTILLYPLIYPRI